MGNSSLPRWAVFKPTKTRINPRLYLHTYTTSTRPPTRPLLLYFTWPCPANAIRICRKNECLSGKRINNVAVIKTVNLQNSSSSEQSGPPGRSPECHTLYPLYFPISSLLLDDDTSFIPLYYYRHHRWAQRIHYLSSGWVRWHRPGCKSLMCLRRQAQGEHWSGHTVHSTCTTIYILGHVIIFVYVLWTAPNSVESNNVVRIKPIHEIRAPQPEGMPTPPHTGWLAGCLPPCLPAQGLSSFHREIGSILEFRQDTHIKYLRTINSSELEVGGKGDDRERE